jgi:hypothetical protein
MLIVLPILLNLLIKLVIYQDLSNFCRQMSLEFTCTRIVVVIFRTIIQSTVYIKVKTVTTSRLKKMFSKFIRRNKGMLHSTARKNKGYPRRIVRIAIAYRPIQITSKPFCFVDQPSGVLLKRNVDFSVIYYVPVLVLRTISDLPGSGTDRVRTRTLDPDPLADLDPDPKLKKNKNSCFACY